MALTFMNGFAMVSFFVFIWSVSFIYVQNFGLRAVAFSYAFAFNAVGFFGASQSAAVLGKKYGAYVVMRRAIIDFCLMAFRLLSATLLSEASLYVTMGGLFLTFGCLGLVLLTAMVSTLDKHGVIAGLPSSLGGALQMMVGACVVAAMGAFFNGTAFPMITTIYICSLASFTLSRLA